MLSFLSGVHAFIGKIGGKRFVAALAGALVILGGSLGWWDEATASTWASNILLYIGGQGVVDRLTGGLTESPKG